MAADAPRRIAVALGMAVMLALGCAPQKPPLALERSPGQAAVSRASAHGLTASVLPYDEAAERRAFGLSLRSKSVLAAEVRFERSEGNSSTFKVRRTGIRARFAGGAVRSALDPGEVYQRTHLDPNRGGLVPALQLIGESPTAALRGAGAEDQRRRVVFGASAMVVATIDDAAPVVVGLLFFDVVGLRDARVAAIEAEFEDSTNLAVCILEVPMTGLAAQTSSGAE